MGCSVHLITWTGNSTVSQKYSMEFHWVGTDTALDFGDCAWLGACHNGAKLYVREIGEGGTRHEEM